MGVFRPENIQEKAMMEHNLTLEIFKRADYSKDGIIDKIEFSRWCNTDPESFQIMDDLVAKNEKFFHTYHDILYRNQPTEKKQSPERSAFIGD